MSISSAITTYLTVTIWNHRLRNLSGFHFIAVALLRLVVLTVMRFQKQQCSLRASALTLYTLLSLVPLAALLFAFAKGFGIESVLQRRILESFHGQEEAVQWIISFSHQLLSSTRNGVLVGIGVMVLFVTVIKLLSHIEDSLNHIWGITTPRTLIRKFSDYLSIILVCPVLFVVAGSVTVAISTYPIDRLPLFHAAGQVLHMLATLLPYALVWLLFGFLYLFLPNTRVTIKSGIAGGIVAGTIYQLVQWVYINFQIGISTYNAVYGGFAALPLFLVWLQTSWTVLLLGAVISWAVANLQVSDFTPLFVHASHAQLRLLTLRVAHLIVKRFQTGQQPPSAEEVAGILEMPLCLVHDILKHLTACGIVQKTAAGSASAGTYVPCRSIETVTIQHVIAALEHYGQDSVHVAPSPELAEIARCLTTRETLFSSSPDNKCLKDI